MINNSSSKAEKEELFAEIEEELFNNYRILPLLFYNDTIAVDSIIDKSILDGNGNIDFKSIKSKEVIKEILIFLDYLFIINFHQTQ